MRSLQTTNSRGNLKMSKLEKKSLIIVVIAGVLTTGFATATFFKAVWNQPALPNKARLEEIVQTAHKMDAGKNTQGKTETMTEQADRQKITIEKTMAERQKKAEEEEKALRHNIKELEKIVICRQPEFRDCSYPVTILSSYNDIVATLKELSQRGVKIEIHSLASDNFFANYYTNNPINFTKEGALLIKSVNSISKIKQFLGLPG